MQHFRPLTAASAIALAAAFTPDAHAQSVDDNAVASADDAFGQSVGNERVGLYSPMEVRGFSPVDAGNTRIEGLYFAPVAGLPQRLVQASQVRVGLTAQGYPFPAPTGIIDYQINPAEPGRLLVASIEHGQYGSAIANIDARVALSGTLTAYAGATIRRQQRHEGGSFDNEIVSAGANWRPFAGASVTAFYAFTRSYDDQAAPFAFPAGDYLPPKIERRAEIGQDWTIRDETQQVAGALFALPLDGFRLEGGLFRAERDFDANFTDLALALRPDGTTPNRVIVYDPDNTDGMWSGELRLSRTLGDASLAHRLTLSLRGKRGERTFGGAQRISLGESSLLFDDERPAPVLTPGPDDFDEVAQTVVSAGYSLTRPRRFAIDLGLSLARNRKEIRFAALPDPVISRATPLTGSLTGNANLTDSLTVYGGYIRGFEEVQAAPATAVNRGEAPPAIRTQQSDFGLRYAVARGLSLVAGVFEISKPYFNSDTALVYRELGTQRVRGVELSLAGTITPGLTMVAGTVFSDAKISGELVDAGTIGPRPVGNIRRTTTLNLDWRLDRGASPLSLDLAVDSDGARVANAKNTLVVPARVRFDAGLRYRFTIGPVRALLRAQVANVFNNYSWQVQPNGAFRYNMSRRFLAELRMEI